MAGVKFELTTFLKLRLHLNFQISGDGSVCQYCTWNLHWPSCDVSNWVNVIGECDGGDQLVAVRDVDLAQEVVAGVDDVRANDLALIPIVGGLDHQNLCD